MESTSSPDHGRQSRGLARFWPVHGTPAPGQRESDDAASPESGSSSAESSPGGSSSAEPTTAGASTDAGASRDGSSAGGPSRAAHAGPVAGSGPTGDQPQVDVVRPAIRAGETHVVALGSRRVPDVVNGVRPGFPPDTERTGRAAVEPSPRHGGPPIPTALPLPPSRSPFGGPGPDADAGSGSPFRPAASPFGAGSPFAAASPMQPRRASLGPGSRGPADGSGEPSGPFDHGGRAAGRAAAGRPGPEDRDDARADSAVPLNNDTGRKHARGGDADRTGGTGGAAESGRNSETGRRT